MRLRLCSFGHQRHLVVLAVPGSSRAVHDLDKAATLFGVLVHIFEEAETILQACLAIREIGYQELLLDMAKIEGHFRKSMLHSFRERIRVGGQNVPDRDHHACNVDHRPEDLESINKTGEVQFFGERYEGVRSLRISLDGVEANLGPIRGIAEHELNIPENKGIDFFIFLHEVFLGAGDGLLFAPQ
jgi:hypothetical protein